MSPHNMHSPPQGIRLATSLDKTTLELPVLFVDVTRLLKRIGLAMAIAAAVLLLTQTFIAIGGVILVLSLVMTHRLFTMPRTRLEVQPATLVVHKKGHESVIIPLESLQGMALVYRNTLLHSEEGEVPLNASLSPDQLTWLEQCLQDLATHRRTQLLEEGHDLTTDPVPADLKNLQHITT